MLSREERAEIDEELERYPDRRAVGIDALKIVQRHRGWVSDEGLADVAGYLELSRAELEGVATFYNLIFRRPVGRHVIRVCDSVSCWIMGYESLRDALNRRLGIAYGQTTPDERFTLLPIQCLGTCDRAPALMIDEDLFRDLESVRLEPEQLERILARYP